MLLNITKETDALPTLQIDQQGQYEGSTHSVTTLCLFLTLTVSHMTLGIQERIHQPHYPPSPNLFHLLDHQTSVNGSMFSPSPSFPSKDQQNPLNPSRKLSRCIYPAFPFMPLVQTATSLALALILMPPPKFSAESTNTITSIYHLKAHGFWTSHAAPPYNWAPGLRLTKDCTWTITPNQPHVLGESCQYVVPPPLDSRLLEDTH